MGSSENFETRLTAVEAEVAIARREAAAARTLAAGADRDVSDSRAELRAHTRTLGALRETQLQHYVEYKVDIAEARTDLTDFKVEMRAGLAEVKSDVAGVKTDLAEVKSDVAGVKTDLAEVKAEVAGVKTDLAEVKAEVAADLRETRAHNARGLSALRETQLEHYAEHKADSAEIKLGIAHIVRMLEDLPGRS